jgi:putative nucleotidyltransferase with HDIG domain
VLRAVADTIRAEFRAYDAVGRLGGDELVMVLPDVDTGAALTIAARVRTMVAVRVAASELGVALTASVGVAGWYDPLTAGELLDRADRALLVAKRQGKDRALPASTETEAEFAQLEQAAGPAELVSQLWDLVSQCELPREVLDRLPSFLRRTLALEEVALYVPEGAASTDGLLALERSARARAPGDPAPPAFRELRLALDPERTRALSSVAISRDRLGELCRALGAEGTALATEEPAGSYAAVAVVRERELHALMLMRCAAPQFPLPRLRLAQLLSGQALTALVGQSRGAPRSAVGALAAAIDARDNYTHDHSEQVVSLAERTAKLLGLSPAETERVRDGAMLHDVGKVAIPNEILYNPGALDEEEWAIMCEHPVIGERILRRTPELEAIAPMVRHEHERWDGTGYPDGLARDEIPIGSRIILACDAYNAMITARPYRDPMTDAEAIDKLRRAAGSQFDPEVVAALLEVLGDRETP